MFGLTDSEIPGAGKVDTQWVSTPLPPVNLSTKKVEEDGDAMAVDLTPQPVESNDGGGGGDSGKGDRGVENLDYEVADDDDYVI
jgi:hypothetical protein